MKKTWTSRINQSWGLVIIAMFFSGAIIVPNQLANAEGDGNEVITKLTSATDASDKASDAMKTFIKDKLIPLCQNETLAAEVKKQNDKKVSLDEIKKIDEEWIAAEEELPIHEEVMGNACAQEIIKIIEAAPQIREAFVMDNQGAVVGENSMTSDYWQGDEEKWTGSYNDGKGGVDIGEVKFDKSANASLQQVSLPIIDAEGNVIGAITCGVDVGKL